MFDNLGDRMKGQYENRTRVLLPRRTYTIIRVDGKAFHTLTRKLDRPFDYRFMALMDSVAVELCKEITGAELAYLQSDEVSVLVTDFARPETCAWFDGNLQKLVSISASIATAEFNRAAVDLNLCNAPAHFDARAFTIPDSVEVENYFIWRQQDWTRNSVQMAARSLYSHKELHGKHNGELQELCFQKGVNWNDYPTHAKRGRCVCYEDRKWSVDLEIPVFTQDREYLKKRIPKHWEVIEQEEKAA